MEEGRDHWLHELEDGVSDDPASCPCEPMASEDLLFLMYTSGTTAKPKGIVHTTAGYLCGVASTHSYIFDLKPESDVYWCAADIGWITGHSYIVYGPLCNGATSVLYEGTPDFPDKDRWWSIIERYGVTILYTAPTAIRSHMKWGPEYAQQHDLSSLRLLGSVGEPINPEAWIWYREHIGGDRTPIVDTWWQTETGMILITPLPGVTTLKPGSATKPFPGVDAGVFDERGNEVGPGGGGYLVLKRPWPAMLRGIFGDDERYRETYWSKYENAYFAGDGARIDRDGDYWLLGRVDDVMNVSGHRISTIEVESALVDHQDVAEAAVCSRKDATTGEAIVAYVTLKSSAEPSVEKLAELRDHVAKKIGPIAKPSNIVFTPELPKTRSGKIMRRLLRDVAENRPLGDTTTLADPAVVSEIRDRRRFRAAETSLDDGTPAEALDRETQRRLAVDCFNKTWTLMEKQDRTREEDDEMLHCTHASAYHWHQVGTAANRARGEWQCSRVYTVLDRPEPALDHARRCLEIVEESPAEMEEWDLPAAYEALARAHWVAGEPRGVAPVRRARPRGDGEDRGRGRPEADGVRLRDDSPVTRFGAIRVEWLDRTRRSERRRVESTLTGGRTGLRC